jgi:glycosyltransferase involved in cell wall biosynthesis
MWIGKHLSKLELLTMHSFLGNGHEFHLWAYDDIETRLPDGVVLQDANEIIPRESIFTKRGWDSESGVGRGSFGAFSDLFRYKLLYEKGGYWADMDITCLKPLDFSAEYLFRSHRVGVVGNLMKCPRGSRLMLETYEETARTASPDSPWLMTNRVLSANVNRLGLSGFVRTDICNQDSWLQVVKLLIEKPVRIPDAWYAIHWVNEFWRTITESNGYYRGKKVVEYVPDKNHARAGSTLAGLYQKYGMLDAERLLPGTAPSEASLTAPSEAALTAPSEVPPSTESATQKAPPKAVLNRPADRQPVTPQIRRDRHVNILITSMALGGAERIVHEILMGLAPHKPTSKLFVMYQANPSYPVEDSERMRVFSLASLDEDRMVRTVALEVLASPHRVLYTHMVPARLLRRLGDYGVRVVPVIHNSQPSWQDPADAFDHPNIPFVVAVSDAVAEQMRAQSCPAPVVTIRHELHRWFTPEELQANRDRIRGQYGIRGNTILIGMVGQFKLQKAYTRAARVLQQIQERHPAKLMILGGWDHAHGAGRAAYTAFCRQALELGIMPDVITPGSVHPVEPYYAAFDVFLNTSMYEGLSIAMLEAIQCGCPVVTADAGGNREVLSPTSALVKDAADIDAYVNALWPLIEERQRTVPRKPGYPDLIPCLWQLLARYGVPDPQERSDTRTGTLFVAGNINLGGPQRSLMNLLSLLSAQHRCALGVLDQVYSAEYLQAIEQAGAAVFSVHTASGMLERAERLLHMIESLHVRNVCFWNAPTPIKLLLTKVLHQRAIRLIDVSPGPMLFDEMAGAETFQRRICLTDAQYFRRLDRFVAKYTSGTVPPCVADVREKTVVIPNGVPEVASSESIPEVALPEGVHPEFVIGTCCRIVPSKQIEFLIDVMRSLTPAVPQASLVIVGGVDPFHIPYWNDLCKYLEESGLQNIHFVGGKADVRPYLQRFKVFVMISANQGCPNASLEAMMMGLPVVANANGGTGEQVRHGVNGYLVSDADPTDMGRRVASLLSDPKLRAVLGAAGRKIAHTEFSMEQMVARYREILESD